MRRSGAGGALIEDVHPAPPSPARPRHYVDERTRGRLMGAAGPSWGYPVGSASRFWIPVLSTCRPKPIARQGVRRQGQPPRSWPSIDWRRPLTQRTKRASPHGRPICRGDRRCRRERRPPPADVGRARWRRAGTSRPSPPSLEPAEVPKPDGRTRVSRPCAIVRATHMPSSATSARCGSNPTHRRRVARQGPAPRT